MYRAERPQTRYSRSTGLMNGNEVITLARPECRSRSGRRQSSLLFPLSLDCFLSCPHLFPALLLLPFPVSVMRIISHQNFYLFGCFIISIISRSLFLALFCYLLFSFFFSRLPTQYYTLRESQHHPRNSRRSKNKSGKVFCAARRRRAAPNIILLDGRHPTYFRTVGFVLI